jgi:hypothetical protein
MQRKILHIITSKAFGGLELYVTQLIKQLQKAGFINYIICQKNSRIEKELNNCDININYCKSHFYLDLKDLFAIVKIIKKYHIDIIHSHTRVDVWKASLSKSFLKDVPHINSVYMLPTKKQDGFHRFIYSKVDAIVSSSTVSNKMIERNYPIDKNKIKLIRYGRNIELYKRDLLLQHKIRNQWYCRDDEIVVMSMSRIDEQKGLRDFALSFDFLPTHIKSKVRYWIIGEPTIANIDKYGCPHYELESENLYNWLKQYSKKPQINNQITLIPFQNDFISYLGCADIFVLPSHNEMYSLSVIDAMLMGLPVIGTRAEGTQEQIANGKNGILVDISSPKQIADAITELIENPEKMLEISENAKCFATKTHNWKKTIQDWIALYSEILQINT